MKPVFAIVTLCSLLFSSAAFADIYRWTDDNGIVHYGDRSAHGGVDAVAGVIQTGVIEMDLGGVWHSRGEKDFETALTIEANGKFVFDRSHQQSADRLYMCGEWDINGRALDLDVQGLKRRLANGSTEQMEGQTSERLGIVNVRRNQIVIDYRGKQILMEREQAVLASDSD